METSADIPFKDGPLRINKVEADGIAKFISALKPGVYIKCGACNKMKYSQQTLQFRLVDGRNQAICEDC